MTSLNDNVDWKKNDGLVPAIVQHAVTGRVLMLGYMNAEALVETQLSKLVTFYSRSRNCLWTKGETSVTLDCARGRGQAAYPFPMPNRNSVRAWMSADADRPGEEYQPGIPAVARRWPVSPVSPV